MANREDWCSNQIVNLQNEDLRISTLNEIKNHFAAIPQDEAVRTANNLELSLVFDCLNDSNTEQIELACDVLSLCMGNLNLGESTNRYGTPIERALNHPFPSVKIVALKEIQRNITDEDLLINISKRHTLITSIINCVGYEDLGVAKFASAIICSIGINSFGIQQLLSRNCIKTFHDVMVVSEVVRLRVNEMLVNISKMSDGSMQALQAAGLLDSMLQDIDNNDILLKMNIIELLSQLVTTRHGYGFLENQGVIRKILNQLEIEDPLSSMLCEPGIIKFFGHMAFWKPTEMVSKYPAPINKVFENIQSEELTLVGISLDTLGHIAEKNEGKYALDSMGNHMTNTLKIISKRLDSFPTDMRIRALNCLENLFRINEFESKVTNLIRKWYYALHEDPMECIYSFAKNPFAEIRLAGLGVLAAMSLHHWGQECFRNTAGIIEYLLDRKIETNKECRIVKYDIVKTISTSSVFDHSTQGRLQAFVKEGPFYVEAVTEVAVEGED